MRHTLAFVAPTTELADPGGHNEHADAPADDHDPAGHSVQASLLVAPTAPFDVPA